MSAAALNMSQAMVLCLGADGHIAVEPAEHNHYADGCHARSPESGDHSHVGPARSRSCIDIPLPDRTGDTRQEPISTPTHTVGSPPPIQEPGALDATGMAASLCFSRLLSYSSSLRSTILLV